MSSLELSAILIPALFAGLVAILATVVIERGGGAGSARRDPIGLASASVDLSRLVSTPFVSSID